MEEQEVEVTEAEVLQLLANAADEPDGFAAHQMPAGVCSLRLVACAEHFRDNDVCAAHAGTGVWLTATWQQNSLR